MWNIFKSGWISKLEVVYFLFSISLSFYQEGLLHIFFSMDGSVTTLRSRIQNSWEIVKIFRKWKKKIWVLVILWQAFILSWIMKLDFKGQSTSKSSLPFAHATMLSYWKFQISLYAPHFDPNEWCAKKVSLVESLNLRPFSHESSSLHTRPPLKNEKLKIRKALNFITWWCIII